MIIAGIDEAGYGPLLGPLVVSCTAFAVPDGEAGEGGAGGLPAEVEGLPCIWKLLKAAVVKKTSAAAKGRLLVADSKQVHHLTDGDSLLERAVLAFLAGMAGDAEGNPARERAGAARGERAASVHAVLEALGHADHGLTDHAWYRAEGHAVPHWAEAGGLSIAANMLRGALSRATVEVVAMRTILLPERRYNALVASTNNKGAALVSLTMRHLYFLHQTFGQRGLVVGVDKQGGRDHYTQLLLQSFPEATLKVLQEDEAGSSYMLMEGTLGEGGEGGGGGRRTVIHFREKGETHFLPTALASMTCKYLRELCMHQFNAWWCERVAGLRPTAGYFQDGMRWLGDVEPHLARLGVRREELVRIR